MFSVVIWAKTIKKSKHFSNKRCLLGGFLVVLQFSIAVRESGNVVLKKIVVIQNAVIYEKNCFDSIVGCIASAF